MIYREIRELVSDLRSKQLYPRLPIAEGSPTDPEVNIGGKTYLMFCSNNYLGLANSRIVKEAAVSALQKYGLGSAGSRLMSGTTDIHVELENELASFKQTADCMLFSAGFMANSGSIPALTGAFMESRPFVAENCVIFSDELNHASIIDGCRMSRARKYVYKHKHTKDLEQALARSKEEYRLIVTDGVFSMDGDIAPLPQILELAKIYEAMLMIDDAHATGVIGETGRGTAEHFGVEGEVEINMGTFSKTFGALGGYIAGSSDLIDYLRVASRTYVFSAAMPASTAAGILAILRQMSKDSNLTLKLQRNSDYLRRNLKAMHLNTLESETAIVPILVGNEKDALELSRKLFEMGVYASCVRWPAVAENESRLRITLMASHEKHHLDSFLNRLDICIKKMGLKF